MEKRKQDKFFRNKGGKSFECLKGGINPIVLYLTVYSEWYVSFLDKAHKEKKMQDNFSEYKKKMFCHKIQHGHQMPTQLAANAVFYNN